MPRVAAGRVYVVARASGCGTRRGRRIQPVGVGKDGRLQAFEDGSAFSVKIGALTIDQRPHVIHRRQRNGNEFRGGLNLPFPDPVKRAFTMVGEGSQCIEAEHRARAFERVHPAKDGVDQIPAFKPVGEVEQGLFRRIEQLSCFDAKGFGRVLSAHAPRTLRVTLSR